MMKKDKHKKKHINPRDLRKIKGGTSKAIASGQSSRRVQYFSNSGRYHAEIGNNPEIK